MSCADESDNHAAKSLPAQASTLPVSDKPVTLNFSKAPIKLTTCTYYVHPTNFNSAYPVAGATGPSKIPVLGFDDADTMDDEEDAPSEPNKRMFLDIAVSNLLNYSIALVVKKVAPLISSKKVFFIFNLGVLV